MSTNQYGQSNVSAPDELAATHQLGARIDSYPYQKAQGIIVVSVFVFIIIGELIIGLPVGLFFVLSAFLHDPSSASNGASPGAQLFLVLFGVVLTAAFLGLILYSIKRIITSCRDFGTTIHLYKGGLIRAKGSKADVLRWDQVSDVREKVSGGTRSRATHTYTLRLVDGRKLIFNDLFENVQLLGNHLLREIPPKGQRSR